MLTYIHTYMQDEVDALLREVRTLAKIEPHVNVVRYICMYVCMYIHMYVCMYVYTHICIYVYYIFGNMCVCAFMYIHI